MAEHISVSQISKYVGQEVTIKDGYYPLNAKKVTENLGLLEE